MAMRNPLPEGEAWLRNCNTYMDTKGRGLSVLTKILIVDDSPAEVRLMQSVLDRAGYMSVSVTIPCGWSR